MKAEDFEKYIKELSDTALEHYKNGYTEEAKELFEQLIEYNPFDLDTYYNLAKVYYDLGHYQKSIDVLLELIDMGDKDDSTFELIGDAYLKVDKHSDALLAYKRVSDISIVKEKIKQIKAKFKKEGDKLYLQYMSHPYPNLWKVNGIPESYFELLKFNGVGRRRQFYTSPYTDINFIQLKYWDKYKDLTKLRVLNAGCGTGEAMIQSAMLYPEVEFVAIDMSENSINIAKEHVERLKLSNITFLQGDLSKISSDDLGYFNIAISTGVIHHLYNPLQGIVNLRNVLKEDGILAGMVYSSIGRREVYDFRDIFKNLFSEVEGVDYKLDSVKSLINSVAEWQRLYAINYHQDLKLGDQGIVDLLLNENETSYTTEELRKIFSSAEMELDFYDNGYLDPLFFLYNVKSDSLRRRIGLLDKSAKLRIAEILNGHIYKFNFVAYKNDFKPKQNMLTGSWLDSFPILWSGVKLMKDEKGYFVDLSYIDFCDCISRFRVGDDRVGRLIRYDITELQAKFLERCSGQTSVRQLINDYSELGEIKDMKKLIFDLMKSEVLFLRETKENFYIG